MSLKSVEDFVSPEFLEEKVKQISPDELGDKEKDAVLAFQRALKRRRDGKGDDDWGRDDEKD